MAGGFDGSIRIDSRIDSKGFNAGVRGMVGSLKSLAAAVGLAFGIGAVVAFGKSAVDAASRMASALTGLQSILNGQGKSFADAKKFINSYIQDGLIPATDAVNAYKNLSLTGFSSTEIEKMLVRMKDAAAFGRQSTLSLGQAVESATSGIRQENSILIDNAGITKNLFKMWEEYAASIGKTVNNLTQAEKNQATFNGVMQETRFQIGDAARLSGTYAGKVLALSKSFEDFKVAVGNSIIPILSAIIPYIKTALNWLTSLFNTFAAFMQAFFGMDVSATVAGYASDMGDLAGGAEDAADAQNKLGKETKKAGQAAKGALAAFDSLNVLQMETGSGAGTGGGAGGGGGGIKKPELPKFEIPPEILASVEAFKQRLIELFKPAAESFNNLKRSLEGLGSQIWQGLKWAWENILVPLGKWAVSQVLPKVFDLFAAAVGVLSSALLALKPLGLWLFETFLKPLGQLVGKVLIVVLEWLTDRLNGISMWINANQATFRTLIAVVAAIAAGFLLASVVGGILSAVLGIAGVAMTVLTGPIGAVIAIIAVLIVIIGALIKHWPEISAAAQKAWAFIISVWKAAGPWFKANVLDPIVRWFKQAWTDIQTAARLAWMAVQLVWVLARLWFATNVIDPITKGFETALKNIKEGFETTFSGIAGFVKGVVNGIIDTINGLIRAVAAGLNAMIDALNSVHVSIPDWVPTYGGKSFGLSLPGVPVPQIPRLATGAVIPPNAARLAVVGDNRTQREIISPEDLMRQIVREEMGEGGEMTITMPVYLDSNKIYEGQKKVQRRRGKSLITGGAAA
jgi:hypothetical protein